MAADRNMEDYLIMLLSTDWFLPYWSEIKIDLDEERKFQLQQGCREIAIQILSGGNSYYECNFSADRKQQTDARFVRLVHDCNVRAEIEPTYAEWTILSHEKLTPSWFFYSMTIELVVSHPEFEDALFPSPQIIAEVEEAWNTFCRVDFRFPEICSESKSNWDIYTRSLTDGAPEALGNIATEVWILHQFEKFWNRLRERLEPREIEDLLAWYRASARNKLSEDRPELIPSYIA